MMFEVGQRLRSIANGECYIFLQYDPPENYPHIKGKVCQVKHEKTNVIWVMLEENLEEINGVEKIMCQTTSKDQVKDWFIGNPNAVNIPSFNHIDISQYINKERLVEFKGWLKAIGDTITYQKEIPFKIIVDEISSIIEGK